MDRRVVLTEAPYRVAQSQAAGHTVVTPNPRAARALGEAHAVSLIDIGLRLLRQAHPPRVPAPSAMAQRLLKRAVGDEIGSYQPERLAEVLRPSLARLLRAAADWGRLSSEGTPRVRQLARVALRYRESLEARGWVDPAEQLHAAAKAVTEREPLLVYGYARLDADERAFLDACAGDGSVLVLPGGESALFDGNRETLRDLVRNGWTAQQPECGGAPTLGERLAARWLGADQDLPDDAVRVQAYADPEAEVRGVLGQVKQLLAAGEPADELVVVARDEELYVPLVMAVAAEFETPVHPRNQIGLTATRLGGWLTRLLDMVVEDAPYETTLCALADPLSGSLTCDQRRAAQSRRAQGLATWIETLPEQALLPPLMTARGAAWPLAEWVAWLRGVFAVADLPDRLMAWPAELTAWKKLDDGLRLLAEAGEPQAVPAEIFAREVADLLAASTVATDAARGGVDLHTPLALYGSARAHVFVLGAAAGLLPAALHDDPYLDAAERHQLTAQGVRQESAAEEALRERLSFWSLLQCVRRSLVLSRPRVLDRGEAPPSPFLGELGVAESEPPLILASATALRPYALGNPGDPVARAAGRGLMIENRRESAAPPDEFDGVLGLPLPADSFSVSRLIVFGQCPFRWFGESVLGLAAPEEVPAEPEPSRMGSLLHRVLELVVRGALRLGAPTDREVMVRLLEPALAVTVGEPGHDSADRRLMADLASERRDRDAESLRACRRWSHWPLLRGELLATWAAAVRCDDFLGRDAEPEDFEIPLTGVCAGISVRGRADRVDRLEDGRRRLIDYKSGSGRQRPPGVRGADGRLSVDVQLPLYERLYADQTGYAVEARYFKVRGRALAANPRDADANREAMEAFVASVPARLAAGEAPVTPDRDLAACEYCDLAMVCRRGPRLARKECP
jgi:hypothetical protein